MIICNKCGQPNPDHNLLCEGCGHKLQSPRRDEPSPEQGAPLRPLGVSPLPESMRSLLMKMAESWAYIGVLVLVGVVCAVLRTLWPLVPAVGAVALAAWLRKI